ncbi:MAG: efflux RND transporter periplasmic adaptor subunit [Planctomycetota bacterium]|jgi:multidrug efflux pump subunit AcrA (membrane-fusion protein)
MDRGVFMVDRFSRFLPLFLPVVIIIPCPGCRRETPSRPESPRPVVAVELAQTDPTRALRLTGVVESWAEEEIAFEVPGRVTYIVEADTDLEGRWVENGAVVIEGDVLARIDPAPYAAAVEAAEADVQNARVNLEKVLPAYLDEAKALLARAADEFERINNIPADSRAKYELVNAISDRDAAMAQVDRAEAELEAGRAQLARAQATLTEARLNLDYTTLYAPFSGDVAEVHVVAGGYARAGDPVAHLVLMDPVNVVLTVSAETHRSISVQDRVRLHVSGAAEPLIGSVYQKSTIADPATRTFTITVVCRNRSKSPDGGQDSADARLPRIARLLPVTKERVDRPGPLFVEESKALQRDEDGYFVWLAEGMTLGDNISTEDPTFVLRKVRVVPGERRMNYQGLYLLRELRDTGGIEFEQLAAAGVPEGVADGDRVALLDETWILQPGNLVEVQFRPEEGVYGFYVPLSAIVPAGEDRGHVFLVDGAEGQAGKALKVDVTLHETVADLRRIQSVQPEVLSDGDLVITQGVNYLQPGEPVSVVEKTVVSP